MKIYLDDVTKTIEDKDGNVLIDLHHTYNDYDSLLSKILSNKQLELYYGNDDRRIFSIKKDKYQKIILESKKLEDERQRRKTNAR